jgi:uncharacterized membrane protein
MNHHHLIHRIESADPLTLYAKLGFLFCLSLLPFFTAYVLEKKMVAFAVSLYAISMAVTGTAFLGLRLAVHRNLQHTGDLKPGDKTALWEHLACLGLYPLAVPVAYYRSHLALAIVATATLIWIIPNLATPRHAED